MTLSPARARAYRAPASRRWQPHDETDPAPYTQGALALTYSLAGGVSAEPGVGGLTLVPDATDLVVPDAEQWAARFVQAVIEVVSSDRPLSQLARWTKPEVFVDLGQRRERVARHRSPGQARAGRQQVASVHVWQPSREIAEVAARVTMGVRSRAIAARLEFERGRWLCTALTFG